MLQELMLGLAVGFAFIIGSLLGSLTADEGNFIRKTVFAKFLRKFSLILAVLYSVFLWLALRAGQTEAVSLVLFGLVIAQTSMVTTKKLDGKSVASGLVFVAVFFALSFFK